MSIGQTYHQNLMEAIFEVSVMQSRMDQSILETADFLKRMTAHKPQTRPEARMDYKGVS